MSEWNRDRDTYRYGRNDDDPRGRRESREASWPENDRRSFAGRDEADYDYPGAGQPDYTSGAEGYGGYGSRRGAGGNYGGASFGTSQQGYADGRHHDYGRSDSLSYGRHRHGNSGSDNDRHGEDGYRGRSAGYGQNDMPMGGNERLQRVSDGESDRGHFLGGGMMRGGEHRGRGPKNYTRSDDRIREDVNDRLSDDAWLDASEIDVQVSSGEVTLTGTVNAREDKRRAEDLAEQVSGVKHVQNSLRVQPSSGGGQATSTTMGASAGQGPTTSAATVRNTGSSGVQ